MAANPNYKAMVFFFSKCKKVITLYFEQRDVQVYGKNLSRLSFIVAI